MCHPRGRTSSVARRSTSRYARPPTSRASVPRTASRRLACPSTRFCQVGEHESSRSAMKTRAPELRALIIIFRSTGPVISTRRSFRSAGAAATCQSPWRTAAVAAGKSSGVPADARASSARRAGRAPSRARRRSSNVRCSVATNAIASAVRSSSPADTGGPTSRTPVTKSGIGKQVGNGGVDLAMGRVLTGAIASTGCLQWIATNPGRPFYISRPTTG